MVLRYPLSSILSSSAWLGPPQPSGGAVDHPQLVAGDALGGQRTAGAGRLVLVTVPVGQVAHGVGERRALRLGDVVFQAGTDGLQVLLAGVNQAVMMSLAMVIIASMIGARGLGEDVLSGINNLDMGQGILAGAAIVILAIVFDRITQSFGVGKRARRQVRK